MGGGLARLGVRRETLVGMSFERRGDAVVATVGIVLAGGAYVPVNPAFPRRRIADLLIDSGIGVVVCGPSAVERVATVTPDGVEVVSLARSRLGAATPTSTRSWCRRPCRPALGALLGRIDRGLGVWLSVAEAIRGELRPYTVIDADDM